METLMAFSLVVLVFVLFGLFELVLFVPRFIKRRSLVSQKEGEGTTMSKDLVPRLLRHLRGFANLYIVERDASALMGRDTRRLRHFLRRTLESGSTVRYVLTAPHPGDERKLAQLKLELEQGTSGKIEFCLIAEDQAQGADQELVKNLTTFHPMLIEDSGRRMMWIEGYHPLINETLAYNWEFVPPEDAATDSRWDKYMGAITGLIERYGPKQKVALA